MRLQETVIADEVSLYVVHFKVSTEIYKRHCYIDGAVFILWEILASIALIKKKLGTD